MGEVTMKVEGKRLPLPALHGDLTVEPARADVELMLTAIEATLRADASQS